MKISDGIAAFAAACNTAPPRRLGQRYDATGFLPDPGNTVVCHLDTGDPVHAAVLRARARMRALPGAERFLFTPEASLHMTVFEGVLDNRRTPDAWPRWIPADAPVAAVTEAMIGRLAGFAGPGPVRVRATGVVPTGLTLAGATPQDEDRLAAWREALTDPFGYRQAEHDAYRHHMTFAYPLDWLPDDLLPVWEADLRAIFEDLSAEAPVIPLRPPAFCRFADMTQFEELATLAA